MSDLESLSELISRSDTDLGTWRRTRRDVIAAGLPFDLVHRYFNRSKACHRIGAGRVCHNVLEAIRLDGVVALVKSLGACYPLLAREVLRVEDLAVNGNYSPDCSADTVFAWAKVAHMDLERLEKRSNARCDQIQSYVMDHNGITWPSSLGI